MPLDTRKLKLTKEKWENFQTIIRIMELNEINKLRKMMETFNNNLVYFKEQKKMLQRIEGELSVRKTSKFFEHEEEDNNNNKKKTSLYVVMSPEKNDDMSKAMMNKTKEFIAALDKETSYFISFGHEANKLLNRQELKIVDSFKQFNTGLLEEKSINNIIAISSLSKMYMVFEDVYLVFPEINETNGKLFVTKILPFSNSSEIINDLSEEEKNVSEKTSLFFEIPKISSVQWFPSIDSVYGNLIESLIKLKINIVILKHKINVQKEVVAMTKKKREKILDYLDELLILIQRGRKEEITLELSLLSSSFKLLQKSTMDDIQKMEDEEEEKEDLLWENEVSQVLKKRK